MVVRSMMLLEKLAGMYVCFWRLMLLKKLMGWVYGPTELDAGEEVGGGFWCLMLMKKLLGLYLLFWSLMLQKKIAGVCLYGIW